MSDSGSDLPVSLMNFAMVASSDKKSVDTIGGSALNDGGRRWRESKDIFKYSCKNNNINDCQWTMIDTKLKAATYLNVAFSIPNDLVEKLCN